MCWFYFLFLRCKGQKWFIPACRCCPLHTMLFPHIFPLFVSFPLFSTLSPALLSLLVLSGTWPILSLESGIFLVRKHWVLECWAGALEKITILVCFSSAVTAMEVSACPVSLFPAWCLSSHLLFYWAFSSSLMRKFHVCEVLSVWWTPELSYIVI